MGIRIAVFVLTGATALVLAGCSHHQQVPPLNPSLSALDTKASVPQLGGLLPAPGTLTLPETEPRRTSFTEDDLVLQAENFETTLPHQRVTATAMGATYEPDYNEITSFNFTRLSYAMYICNAPGYDRGASFDYRWNTPPAEPANVYFGLANWGKNRWDWYQGNAATHVLLPAIDRYFDLGGALLLAVVQVGEDTNELDRIHIGNRAPVAVLTPTSSFGVVPLALRFDASGSSDAEGPVVSYEWDLNGDGTFDVNGGTNPILSFTGSFRGEYHPAVRVTDEDGITAVASADVFAADASQVTYGSNLGEKANAVAVAADHGLVLFGERQGAGSSVLVAKVSAAGEGVFAHAWNGPAVNAQLNDGIADGDGSYYACGYYSTQEGSTDGLLQKWGANGELLWSRGFGTTVQVNFTGMLQAGPSLFVCGNAFTGIGPSSAFVAAFDLDGGLIWCKHLTDGNNSIFSDIAWANSALFPPLRLCGRYTKPGGSGNDEMLYAAFNSDGTIDGALTLGGTGSFEEADALATAGSIVLPAVFVIGRSGNDLLLSRVGVSAITIHPAGATTVFPDDIRRVTGSSVEFSAEVSAGTSLGLFGTFDSNLAAITAQQIGSGPDQDYGLNFAAYGGSFVNAGFAIGALVDYQAADISVTTFPESWQTLNVTLGDLQLTPEDTSLAVDDLTDQFEINRQGADQDLYIELRSS